MCHPLFLLLFLQGIVVSVLSLAADKIPHVICTITDTETCSMGNEIFGVGNTTEVFTNNTATRCVESADPFSFSFTKRDSDKVHINFQVIRMLKVYTRWPMLLQLF
jgi:hypothetical protein